MGERVRIIVDWGRFTGYETDISLTSLMVTPVSQYQDINLKLTIMIGTYNVFRNTELSCSWILQSGCGPTKKYLNQRKTHFVSRLGVTTFKIR